ncbi:hypothetical protein AAH979_35345 [Plantactinospora sp. ZYX-F-223]|uniref:hypothetical protein n=1 Tax=Plantactinospora sp. ZYX-F-223 TaxID=3144103 RepID=UPI0031FC21AE
MLEVLQERIATFRRLEAEHRFGVVIDARVPLPRIPELPAGLYDVFDLVGRVETGVFRFEPPPVVRTVETWSARPPTDAGIWVEHALPIGREVVWMDDDNPVTGGQVDIDVVDGSVFHLDGDDFADYCHRGGEGRLDCTKLAPDLPTFFARYVFGPEYPDLVGLICRFPAYRTRRRRYADPWMRLLVAAGLVAPPASGKI